MAEEEEALFDEPQGAGPFMRKVFYNSIGGALTAVLASGILAIYASFSDAFSSFLELPDIVLELKAEIGELRKDIEQIPEERKSDISALRQEFQREIDGRFRWRRDRDQPRP